jgi:hypothetical protein
MRYNSTPFGTKPRPEGTPLPFKNVEHSFPADVQPAIPMPALGGPPAVGMVPVGLGAVGILAPAPPPQYLVSLHLERTAQSTAVQPGHGLAAVPLNPIDTPGGGAHAAFLFGTQSRSFNAVAPPANADTEQFMICPGDGAPVRIRWAVRHAAAGITATLDLFRCGEPGRPIWTRHFANADGVNLSNAAAWAPAAAALPNTTYYECDFNGNVAAPGPGIVPEGSNFFLGGWLDSKSGPYKLLLTISGPGDEVYRKAWTYFHVPAHKFKLVRYVPSTEMGCFGLELDPCKQDVKVIAKSYFGYEGVSLPFPDPFPADHNRHDPIKERIFKDWSAHYLVRIGGGTYRPLAFVVPQGHGPVDVVPPNAGTYAPYITRLTRAAGADYPVVLTNGVGGSGVNPSDGGHWLHLFERSSFNEQYDRVEHNAEVHQADIARLTSAIKQAMRAAPPGTGFSSAEESCSVVIGMPASSVDPDAATAAWLEQLASAANGVVGQLSGTIEVLLTGANRAGRPAHSQHTRQCVSRVKAILSGAHLRIVPGGDAPPPDNAPAIRDAQAGFRFGADAFERGTGERRKVRIDFGERPGSGGQTPRFPYNASVHEFGHVFGYPDEYMDYSCPVKGCLSVRSSQPRIDQLATRFGVASAVWPKLGGSNKNADLMSMGTLFHERYYLTFMEALAKLMGTANPPTFAGPATRDHRSADFPVIEDPAFGSIANALRTAANAFEDGAAGLLTAADLRARVLTEAGREVVGTLLYLNVLDSDAVVPALSTGRNQRHHYVQTGMVRDGECLHCSIQVEALKAFLKLDNNENLTAVLNQVCFPVAGAERAWARLRALRPFAGSGRLQVNPAGIVTIHNAAHGGGSIQPGLAGTALNSGGGAGQLGHADGREIWIEGAAQGSASIWLELLDGAGAVISQTEPTEIVCGPPVDVLVDGKPIGASLVMPLRGGLNSTFGRTAIKLKKRSLGVDGATLVRISSAGGAGDIALYDARGALQGLPYDVPEADYQVRVGAYDPMGEVTLQLEGTVGSGVVNDRNLMFSLGAGPAFTTVGVTVVELRDLTVTIRDTAPLTPRTVGVKKEGGLHWQTDPSKAPMSNAAEDRVFRPHSATHGFNDVTWVANSAPSRRADYGIDGFGANRPLVVIENSLADGQHVSIKATVFPQGLAATWMVERDHEDNKRLEQLGAVLPGLVNAAPAYPAGGGLELTAALTADSVGSFHVRLTATNNRDKLLVVNVVMVRAVACNLDDSRVRLPKRVPLVTKQMAGPYSAAAEQHIKVAVGDWSGQLGQASESSFACILRGTVHFIGGGPDGRVGQDVVFAGWIQNIVSFDVVGGYADSAPAHMSGSVRMVITANQAQGTLKHANGDCYFLTGGALPAPLAVPHVMLDTGNIPSGGSTVLLRQSHMDAPANDDILGWRVKASAADSPGTEFFLRHPSHPTALLRTMSYKHTFRSFLGVWADNTAPRVMLGMGAGSRVFALIGDLEWRLDGAWNVDIAEGAWSGAGHDAVAIPEGRVHFHRQHDMVASIDRPFAPIASSPAEGLAEVKMPTMVWAFGWMATW